MGVRYLCLCVADTRCPLAWPALALGGRLLAEVSADPPSGCDLFRYDLHRTRNADAVVFQNARPKSPELAFSRGVRSRLGLRLSRRFPHVLDGSRHSSLGAILPPVGGPQARSITT